MSEDLLLPKPIGHLYRNFDLTRFNRTMTQFSWLIEAPGANYLGVRKAPGDYRGEFYWTPDANKALRFFNEEQADLSLTAIRVLRPDLWGFAMTLGEAWPRHHGWLDAKEPSDV